MATRDRFVQNPLTGRNQFGDAKSGVTEPVSPTADRGMDPEAGIAREAIRPMANQSTNQIHWMVVGQGEQLRREWTQILSDLGFSVVAVEGPSECLAAAKSRTPDIVLMESCLHDTEGWDWIGRLCANSHPRRPHFILAAPAEELSQLIDVATEQGVDEFLADNLPSIQFASRARVAAQLRRSEQRLAEAQRIGQIGSWEWNLADGTAWWSEELYRMCGVDATTFKPSLSAFLELVVPEDRPLIRHHVQATIKSGQPCNIEYRILRGQSIRVHAFAAELMRETPTNSLCLQGTVQDITRRRELEISVRRAERLASLGTLAAGIAHEINNPISAAWTAAETAKTLKNRPNTEPMMDECLDAISDTVKRCQVIVDNVLRFARQESSEKKPHDVNQIVEQAIETTAYYTRGHGIQLSFDRQDDLPLARINAPEIEQVLVNLIRNAAQAGQAKQIHLSTSLQDGQIAMRVKDNGRGIPEQYRERIFDPFFTTNETAEGTGLGLAISHGIVQDNQGTIELTSTVGVGSVFTVLLPAIAFRQSV